jgi:hypothetical protein
MLQLGMLLLSFLLAPSLTLGGQVVDRDTGLPLANVPVLIGPALVCGAQAPGRLPPGVVETTTDADGNFVFAGVPGRPNDEYLEILPADDHLSLHAKVELDRITRGIYRLSKPSPQERAWLEQVNADRARTGVSGRVILDELVEETARYRAREMALTGVYEHADAFTHYESIGGIFPPGRSTASENISAVWSPSTWREAQRQFMRSAAHHGAVVNPTALWAGVGIAPDGKAPGAESGRVDYYAQVFVNGP